MTTMMMISSMVTKPTITTTTTRTISSLTSLTFVFARQVGATVFVQQQQQQRSKYQSSTMMIGTTTATTTTIKKNGHLNYSSSKLSSSISSPISYQQKKQYSRRQGFINRVALTSTQRCRMTTVPKNQQQQQQEKGEGEVVLSQYGTDMDQYQMMESDKLIAVNENDEIIVDDSTTTTASVSKRAGHTFNSNSPRGILHRAFSLFIFDKDKRLLLTQRSSTKITFPNVWTNAVCSHPLYDMKPNEVDIVQIDYPKFPGIKYAAIRKCYHELGIQSQYIPHDTIQFISRYHYWAADTISHGPNTPWGEHEVDYVLFTQLPDVMTLDDYDDNNNNNDYDLYLSKIINPNPDEVGQYKFVTQDELRTMLCQSELLWSPWFIGILERGGWDYWTNLHDALQGKYTNNTIVFFDPSPTHSAVYNLPSHTRQTGTLSTSTTTTTIKPPK